MSSASWSPRGRATHFVWIPPQTVLVGPSVPVVAGGRESASALAARTHLPPTRRRHLSSPLDRESRFRIPDAAHKPRDPIEQLEALCILGTHLLAVSALSAADPASQTRKKKEERHAGGCDRGNRVKAKERH
ncbi:hypothetical protein HPB47_005824 [Ixodes persulcatus]|uniref:Uncharacterized protein n=1 Tax=Ixodes persulcatus TaxID=34615 RepID=A0AC60PBY0_IXOPE|nr:hypothetical protein HPB47_005824 [Ixodes persulcatus]